MYLSFWETDTFFKNTDLFIVGSGIVGLSAALRWRQLHPEDRILIVERGPLPSGASTKNAGFACFGSVSELLDDIESHGEHFVLDLVEKRWKGLQKLRSMAGEQSMDFRLSGNYECFMDKTRYEKCAAAIGSLNEKLANITGINDVFETANKKIGYFGFKGIHHLILNKAEGQLHPGKMMQRLIDLANRQNIRIINGLQVKSFEDIGTYVNISMTNGWEIKSRKLLIATNGFTKNILPGIAVQPARNQVLVTSPVANLKLDSCFHFDRGYVYFRNIGDRVLIGGGRHLSFEEETTTTFGFTEYIQNYLFGLLKNHILPGQAFTIDQKWSGIMGVGAEKRPIIKTISPNIALAVRLGGMGIAIGSLTGTEGVELLIDN